VGFLGFIKLYSIRIEDDSRRGGGNYKDIAFSPDTIRSVYGLGIGCD